MRRSLPLCGRPISSTRSPWSLRSISSRKLTTAGRSMLEAMRKAPVKSGDTMSSAPTCRILSTKRTSWQRATTRAPELSCFAESVMTRFLLSSPVTAKTPAARCTPAGAGGHVDHLAVADGGDGDERHVGAVEQRRLAGAHLPVAGGADEHDDHEGEQRVAERVISALGGLAVGMLHGSIVSASAGSGEARFILHEPRGARVRGRRRVPAGAGGT